MSIVLCIGLHTVLGNNKLEFLHLKLDSDFTLMVVWDNFGGVGGFFFGFIIFESLLMTLEFVGRWLNSKCDHC